MSTVYFRTLLDGQYFSHLPGNPPKTLRDKVIAFEQETFKDEIPENVRVLSNEKTLILGYLGQGKKQYKVIRFQKTH